MQDSIGLFRHSRIVGDDDGGAAFIIEDTQRILVLGQARRSFTIWAASRYALIIIFSSSHPPFRQFYNSVIQIGTTMV